MTQGQPSFHGKSILVTGGARGIGAATALQLASLGAAVTVADRDGAAATGVAERIESRGGRATAFEVDISDESGVALMVNHAVKTFGRLHGAFNNAGIGSFGAGAGGLRAGEVPTESFDKLMKTNVYGTWHCMKAEISHMLETGGGSIVNTASAAGLVGVPWAAAYSVTKHAVVGMTRAVSAEYAKDGIRINCVCPGPVDTEFLPEASRPQAEERVPLGRSATADEVAELAIWLLSDAASYAVGGSYVIDGGMTAAAR